MKRIILSLLLFSTTVTFGQFLPREKCYYNAGDCDAKFLPVMSTQIGAFKDADFSIKVEGGYMGTNGRHFSVFMGVIADAIKPGFKYTVDKTTGDSIYNRWHTTVFLKFQYRVIYIKESVSFMITAGPQVTSTIGKFDFTSGARVIVPFGERFGLTAESNYLFERKQNRVSVGLCWMVN